MTVDPDPLGDLVSVDVLLLGVLGRLGPCPEATATVGLEASLDTVDLPHVRVPDRLDGLVDRGLAEKTDGEYALSDRGHALLADHVLWLADSLEE